MYIFAHNNINKRFDDVILPYKIVVERYMICVMSVYGCEVSGVSRNVSRYKMMNRTTFIDW